VHRTGLPPELSPTGDCQKLPHPDVVVLLECADGAAFLYRITAEGTFGGDTWRATLADGLDQAGYEFALHPSAWVEIPEDVGDPVAYAIQQIRPI
jgi:hypothetical protein